MYDNIFSTNNNKEHDVKVEIYDLKNDFGG